MSNQSMLWGVAVDQYGYVTTHDAHALGIPTVELVKLANRGKLVRAASGVYRFDQFPVTPRDQYMLAVLWTGNPDAALSHETVLAVHDLCDINPSAIHVSIPKGARIRRSGGEGYVLHSATLTDDQIGWWEGIRTVTERTAIEQGIDSNVPVHLLEQAIETAQNRGRISEANGQSLRNRMRTKFAH